MVSLEQWNLKKELKTVKLGRVKLKTVKSEMIHLYQKKVKWCNKKKYILIK